MSGHAEEHDDQVLVSVLALHVSFTSRRFAADTLVPTYRAYGLRVGRLSGKTAIFTSYPQDIHQKDFEL